MNWMEMLAIIIPLIILLSDCSIYVEQREAIKTNCTQTDINPIHEYTVEYPRFDYSVIYKTSTNKTYVREYKRETYDGLYQHKILMNTTIPCYIINNKLYFGNPHKLSCGLTKIILASLSFILLAI